MALKFRKGPAGKGKYYTQAHGDLSYNRKKFNAEAENEIENYFKELKGNFLEEEELSEGNLEKNIKSYEQKNNKR